MKCVNFLETKGKQQFGDNFFIHQEDLEIIYKLLIYTIHDNAELRTFKPQPQKGILLTGLVGCGKTTLMHLLRYFTRKKFDYNMKPCREIVFEFANHGYQSLNQYTLKKNKNLLRLTSFWTI